MIFFRENLSKMAFVLSNQLSTSTENGIPLGNPYAKKKAIYLNYTPYLLVCDSKSLTKEYEKLDITKTTRKEDNNLKLFAAELNFLNLKYEPSEGKKSILLYIGSSPGHHIPKLAALYPELEFHCYDSVEPSEELKSFASLKKRSGLSGVQLFNKLFSYDDIEQYINPDIDVYVITDFTNPNIQTDLEIKKSANRDLLRQQKEQLLMEDMQLQAEWMKIMKPKEACLKFRLPHYYKDVSIINTFDYFQGIVYRNIFTEPKTTECRIFVSDFESSTPWNFQRFEEQMNYYNFIVRETPVLNPITNGTGGFFHFGNGFDQIIFLWILKDYFITRSHNYVLSEELINLYNFIVSK